MLLKSDHAKPVYQVVYDHILDHIKGGILKPEEQIPSEHKMAKLVGVSRMTVHRAYRMLARAGYVYRIQGVGTIVAQPSERTVTLLQKDIVDLINEVRDNYNAHGVEFTSDMVIHKFAKFMPKGYLNVSK